MPTSATGTSTNRLSARGFTLIEILVVLVIVGIVTTTALLSLRGGGEARLARAEIQQLERLVELASDEALYRALELGIEFRQGGYRFLVWDGTTWSPVADVNAMRERSWPDVLAAQLVVEAKPVPLPMAFPADNPVPQVVLLSSGEVSAFELELRAPDGGESLTVHATGTSEREPLAATP